MVHSATFWKKHNISNIKQYQKHETKTEEIIINLKILSKILKHQSDGSQYNFLKQNIQFLIENNIQRFFKMKR